MAGSGGELVVTRGRGVRGGIWSEGRFGYLVEDRLPVQVGLIFDTAGWSSCRGDNTGPAGTFRPTSLGKRLPPNSQPPLLSLLSAASFSFSPSPPPWFVPYSPPLPSYAIPSRVDTRTATLSVLSFLRSPVWCLVVQPYRVASLPTAYYRFPFFNEMNDWPR